jgi:hypothetical protein
MVLWMQEQCLVAVSEVIMGNAMHEWSDTHWVHDFLSMHTHAYISCDIYDHYEPKYSWIYDVLYQT